MIYTPGQWPHLLQLLIIRVPFYAIQMEDRSEATNAAVHSMEVKHGEPLVVQFATP